jgi:cation transporter-like permease
MALGMLVTRFSEISNHSNEIISAWTASLVMFSLYSITSSIVYGMDKLPQLLIDSLATNILVVPIIVVVSFLTAIVTRKRGLDPDNFIIPIETSISDGLTTIGLLVVLILTR